MEGPRVERPSTPNIQNLPPPPRFSKAAYLMNIEKFNKIDFSRVPLPPPPRPSATALSSHMLKGRLSPGPAPQTAGNITPYVKREEAPGLTGKQIEEQRPLIPQTPSNAFSTLAEARLLSPGQFRPLKGLEGYIIGKTQRGVVVQKQEDWNDQKESGMYFPDGVGKVIVKEDPKIRNYFNVDIKPIDKNFTSQPIQAQRTQHAAAKEYLKKSASELGAQVTFVSPSKVSPERLDLDKVKVGDPPLDKNVFKDEKTEGVREDIIKDGKNKKQVVLYGVASQFNGGEAVQPETIKPGQAYEKYELDRTQGPQAQLAFGKEQVELINNSANLGYNGLSNVLDDDTRESVKHGYLTPEPKNREKVIQQFKENSNKIEYVCIGNVPEGKGNSERVYEMLVSAPAFGIYDKSNTSPAEKKEIEYLCALQGYRAQFEQAMRLADENPRKKVICKVTVPGLGVFGNDRENVKKGFYAAAKEFEQQLKSKGIEVHVQNFKGTETFAKEVGITK